MKREKLYNGITNIRPSLIEEADRPLKKKRHPVRWISAIAAMLAVTITGSFLLRPTDPPAPLISIAAHAISEVSYPSNRLYTQELPSALHTFTKKNSYAFLGDSDENRIYSPLNIYTAFGMLAELTDGESRQRLLSVLEEETIKDLQDHIQTYLKSVYYHNQYSTILPATSIWLDEETTYNEKTLALLGEKYWTASFQGTPGNPDYDQLLQAWVNDHTGGLLKNQTEQLAFDPDTVVRLISTLFFESTWMDEFNPQLNKILPFHATSKTYDCTFMREEKEQAYFTGKNFTAVIKEYSAGSRILLILPNDGVETDELLKDAELYDFLSVGKEWEQQEQRQVQVSLPKFDFTAKTDLLPLLKELGLSKLLNEKTADFSNLTQERHPAISQADHTVRIVLDERGTTAGAYTDIEATDSYNPLPPVEFTLDRPFLFAITAYNAAPLFMGVVNQP